MSFEEQNDIYETLCHLTGSQVIGILTDCFGLQLINSELKNFMLEENLI